MSNRQRFVKLVSALLIIGAGAAFVLSGSSAPAQAKSVTIYPDLTPPTAATAASNSKPSAAISVNTAVQTPNSAVPNCSRSSYTAPGTPQASPAQPGLHVNVTPPLYYQVYGNTVAQINSQMAACSPLKADGDAQMTGTTDEAVAWAYSYQPSSDGTCSLSNVSVSINVAQVYPAWQSTAGAASGTTASWQRFITGLQAHESGHAKLDQSAAAGLLSDLQNFPAGDCSSIVAAANAQAQADLAALGQANANYDAVTNHGASQGAVLR